MPWPIDPGTLDIPEGWEVRCRVDLLEPKQTLDAVPRPGVKHRAAMRSNLIVSRWKQSGQTVEDILEKMRAELTESVKGLKVLERGPFAFEDGKEGLALTVRFDAGGGREVVQRHAFRMDAGVVTQLVGTVPAQKGGTAEIDHVMESFSPE